MHNDPYYDFWRKHWITALYIAATLITLICVWLWHNRIQTNPERVFWGMVSQQAASSSVTMSASQTSEANILKQTVALQLGAQNVARANVHLTQGSTSIVTEVIGTPEADYTRYTSVKTADAEQTAAVKNVTNQWAKGQPALFGQASLGLGLSLGSVPVPIANAQGKAQASVLKEIQERNLYKVDFTKVKKEQVNGRLLYTYPVTSEPFVYVQVLKLIGQQIGIKSLESIDPSEYRQLAPIKMHLTVDVRAHHLTKATYDDTGYSQSYTSYDVPVQADIPKATITMAELQKRLQTVTKPSGE